MCFVLTGIAHSYKRFSPEENSSTYRDMVNTGMYIWDRCMLVIRDDEASGQIWESGLNMGLVCLDPIVSTASDPNDAHQCKQKSAVAESASQSISNANKNDAQGGQHRW